jgi:osmotically-inducible protein OsmY
MSKNGVVTLHGIATDYWDVIAMKRLVRRMPGVKRVVEDIDISLGD